MVGDLAQRAIVDARLRLDDSTRFVDDEALNRAAPSDSACARRHYHSPAVVPPGERSKGSGGGGRTRPIDRQQTAVLDIGTFDRQAALDEKRLVGPDHQRPCRVSQVTNAAHGHLERGVAGAEQLDVSGVQPDRVALHNSESLPEHRREAVRRAAPIEVHRPLVVEQAGARLERGIAQPENPSAADLDRAVVRHCDEDH